ncbi:MAG: Calx-beta domain-containing protein [Actinomycetota bacterium]
MQGGGHDAFNFDPETYRVDLDAYRLAEGTSPDVLFVDRCCHGTGPAAVQVDATLGSGTTTDDFEPFTRTLTLQDPIDTHDVFLDPKQDSVVEELETVDLELSNATSGAVLAYPRDAVLTIIDDDGPSRISFEFASYSGFENRRSLLVRVIRSGDASDAASVTVMTIAGTAGDQDYTHTQKSIDFAPGARNVPVTIPLLNNSVGESSETFSVTLSDPVGAELMTPSTTSVAVLDDDSATSEDTVPPYTAFHEPLHGRTYAARNLRQIPVFMQDNNGGSGMDRVQLAIRKNLANGGCRWWTGSDFVRRACDNKLWSRTPSDEYTDTTVFRLRTTLKPSTKGSGITNYTAFSRGWDNVGNVQTLFDKGQNKITFDIK